jgi:asparagine synthase (glutamine-hydrolysing)
MCGIAGEFRVGPGIESRLRAMEQALAHRGPDDAGTWCDESVGLGLAHRRLAIVDLTAAGHQPMLSASGRFVTVFNGEIYNHDGLRTELAAAGAAPAFRGHSDTETLLAGFEHWGVAGTLQKARGMFAIAVWDCEAQELLLTRDRLGEKPLYYASSARGLVFASELRALRRHPAVDGRVDRGALALLLRHAYIPAPFSILKGVAKLPPGAILTVQADGSTQLSSYWDARSAIRAARARPFAGTEAEAVDALDALLRDAVGSQLMSDVPLGAFLSGGVDSSTVVALMQAASAKKVRSFTIGFDVPGYDEAAHARAVADYIGTDHTELFVTAESARDVVPLLARMYAEPFADSSQIPTYLVSALARKHVTVALSGDGGDELFGGYNRHLVAGSSQALLSLLPRGLRRGLGSALHQVSPERWDAMLGPLAGVLPERFRFARPGEKVHKAAAAIGATDARALYRSLISQWPDPARVLLDATEPPTALDDASAIPASATLAEQMMELDAVSYLPDDILAKVDRAAMAVSLETRVPLLDHRVFEFAWSLPAEWKVRDGRGKRPLRAVLDRYVPRALIERPKVGFGVPVGAWLRGPLRGWAEELLSPQRLAREGFFREPEISRSWAEHLSGRRDHAARLWCVLAFQAWYAEWYG